MAISLAAPFVLAGLIQDQPFSASVGVLVSAGDASATLILQNFTGTIPPGLTVTLGSGGTVLTVAGTPTTLGDYSFGFQIHNTAVPNGTAFFTFLASVTTVPASPSPVPGINPVANPGGTTLSRFNVITPPVLYNGALYQVTTDQQLNASDVSGVIAVYKGVPSGNGSPWVPQDYANNPLYSWDNNVFTSIAAAQNPAALNQLIVCFMGSSGFPTPDTPTNVYIKIFDMNTGLWLATSSAGPAVDYSSPYSNTLLDLNLAITPAGVCFVRYARDTSGSLANQYSLYTPGTDTWSAVDTGYDTGGGPDVSLLAAPDGTVTDLYVNSALTWWNSVPHGPSLVPSGGVPDSDAGRVAGLYYPPADAVWFPLIYADTWLLAGSPSDNPSSWPFTEIFTGTSFPALVLGADGKTVAYIIATAAGFEAKIYISIYTGGAWQPPVLAADLFALFAITNFNDGIRAVLINGTDIGVTFGGTQKIGMTTYDSVAYFLNIPSVFPSSMPPPPSPPALACPVINTGKVGVPYSSQLQVTGGTPPYTFAVVS